MTNPLAPLTPSRVDSGPASAPHADCTGARADFPVGSTPAGASASAAFSGRLAYIAAIKPTQTDMLRAFRAVEQHGKPWLPGELDALARRAHAIGGAGLRDVLRAIEGARG